MPPLDLSFDLDSATIPDLRRRLDDGSLTAVALTEAYLDRIRNHDAALRAVLFVDPTAILQAAASDRRRAAGESLGPLDGIPVLVKDNIDTWDMPTTAGSRALLVAPPAEDAPLVRRLRAAGVVLLGKTNLSEWANFRSAQSWSGWSALGGQTVNPHVLGHNPSGSSSGSAVAVAASLAQVAIGTETDGSIVSPGGACGVAGFKPTVGLISRTGVVPISAEQDTPGPMARHVVDLAITLAVLQGADPTDAATVEYGSERVADYVAALDPEALRGARIGLWRIPDQGAGVDTVVESVVDALVGAGAVVVPVAVGYQTEIGAAELPAMWAEFADGLGKYLATRPGAPQTVAELIQFNLADPVELAKFDQDHFDAAAAAPPLTEPEYRNNRALATSLARRSIDEPMTAERLDAIIVPSNGPARRIEADTGDKDDIGSSSPAAVAGYPTATVPAGFVGPLPIGISFVGTRYADAKVLSLAAAFERVSMARRAPGYLPAVDG